MTKDELEHLATLYTNEIGDWTIQLAHQVSVKQYNKLAGTCQLQMLSLNKLAGTLARLLPMLPPDDITVATDAVKKLITPKHLQSQKEPKP